MTASIGKESPPTQDRGEEIKKIAKQEFDPGLPLPAEELARIQAYYDAIQPHVNRFENECAQWEQSAEGGRAVEAWIGRIQTDFPEVNELSQADRERLREAVAAKLALGELIRHHDSIWNSLGGKSYTPGNLTPEQSGFQQVVLTSWSSRRPNVLQEHDPGYQVAELFAKIAAKYPALRNL